MRTPAEVVIDMFGVRPLARELGVSPGTVSKWRSTGMIPGKYHRTLIVLARARRRRLTPLMLIFGRAA